MQEFMLLLGAIGIAFLAWIYVSYKECPNCKKRMRFTYFKTHCDNCGAKYEK